MIIIHGHKHFIKCKEEEIKQYMIEEWYTKQLLALNSDIDIKVLNEIIIGATFVSESIADKLCVLLNCHFDDIFELVHEEVL